ncbi:MAG: RND transporter, partial [Betaproteobacteria bacterium HGW-Betaproteobacteria-21]
QRLSGANASIRAARAAFLPNITLTGFAGASSAELDGLFQGGSGTWSFTPALRLPLFDGGRTQANLNLAEARKLVAIADYEATIQNAFREVAEALAAQRWLAVQVREQTALVTAEAERARLAGLRFERGASSYLDVLDAERASFAAEQALVQLRRARMSSTVNLYRALGGHQAGA